MFLQNHCYREEKGLPGCGIMRFWSYSCVCYLEITCELIRFVSVLGFPNESLIPTASPRQLQHNCTNVLVVRSVWTKTCTGLFAEKKLVPSCPGSSSFSGLAVDEPCWRFVYYRYSIEVKSMDSCWNMELKRIIIWHWQELWEKLPHFQLALVSAASNPEYNPTEWW